MSVVYLYSKASPEEQSEIYPNYGWMLFINKFNVLPFQVFLSCARYLNLFVSARA